MSALDFLNRPIGGSRKEKSIEPEQQQAAPPPRGQRRDVHPETVARPGGHELVVGASPRVDLMPAEIRIKRSQLRTRRSLRLVLFAVIALTVAGCGGAWAYNAVSQATLVSAQTEQQQLLAQQGQFGDVKTTTGGIAQIQAGQKVGDSTEIDYAAFFGATQAALPSGMTISTLSVDAASPITGYAQATVPLQGGRIATVSLQAVSPDLPSSSAVLNALATLPGFVDTTPIQISSSDGVYTTSVTIHLGTAAFADRFATKGQ